ncbi:MAG: Protein-L-isoaspartate (D-aspartate) O-methyltransferase [Candidatus Saccharibacteria bacterium]|nr:Protein-L-isoaspartate (D-aspartate) O-methyltransferase [Candidatus Saccharibacteria bacterium]
MSMVEQAFAIINRQDFIPEDLREQASLDMPLPIGFGQTNSQPSTVQSMLEWLDPQPGQKVLDVGSGSGWTTALLATIVGPEGRVFAVEKVPELVQIGKDNCEAAGVRNVQFFHASDEHGLSKYAPYDRILVSAAAQTLSKALLSQLRVNGKLVVPVQNDILEITKLTDHDYEVVTHPGYVFVPLV